MPTIRVTLCDGCGCQAPDNFNSAFPRNVGWMVVNGSGHGVCDDVAVCCWDCLATAVAAANAPDPANLT